MEKKDKARLDGIRARFKAGGAEVLSSQECLELLLSYASPRGDNYALSCELLLKYGSLKHLMSSPPVRLQHAGALGEYQAVFLTLVGQIGRQISLEDMESRPDAFSDVGAIGRYFLELIRGQPREVFYELCLDGDTFLTCRQLTDGGVLSEGMEARREIIRRMTEGALECAANTVVLCRRLSGELLVPSVSDRVIMEKALAAMDTVRVKFRDYFLVTDDDFVSLAESGLLEHWWKEKF